jgi:hypothetical protein
VEKVVAMCSRTRRLKKFRRKGPTFRQPLAQICEFGAAWWKTRST